MTASHLIACRECDLLHRRVDLPPRGVAHCQRCGAELYRIRANSLEKTLSLVIAGLILMIIVNVSPLITMNMEGRPQDATLISGVRELMDQGLPAVALAVLVTSLVGPLLELLGLLYLLLPLTLGRRPWRMAWVFRWVRRLEPWCMLEVLMLGILVSATKLADDAEIIPGMALYALFALIFVMAAISAVLDPEVVWARLEDA
ncbi:MAG: paraquat-inducible protein A [Desulfosarcinaceae bacterium]|nr:paraquat-inducible protein A [Desulfosarcinaceae bacterium]